MTLDLYIDTAQRKLVQGPLSSSFVNLPAFSQGNTVTLRIRCLTPTANFPASSPPYSLVSTSGRTLQLAIGTRAGNTSTHYAEQYTWTAGPDSADPYFTADLALNTAGVTTLLGSGATATAWLEINLVEGTPRTVLSQQITIEASVIKNDTVTVPAGLTPLSAEAARAMFLTDVWSSQDGSKKYHVYVDNNGAVKADPLS
jgi:hypothetical protein